ncbi:MAG TPA: CHAT domain-containing protein [Thermoanaerobaculia bacterium]|jgi:CHAT domain-containing protein/TolA-binding protein|nr:CHAT domain-containing protein [Thermoanaerobaculia bacterium]
MTAEARAAAVRKALAVLVLVCACRREESPSERLLALAPHSGRPIEARLTGFDWPAARVQRAAHASLLDPARLELAGAASAVIQSELNDSSARARHESGAAYLLIDRDRDAIDALESAVRQSPDNAAYRSDLAAARYTLAVTEKRPHELPQALADADHALRLNPKLPDALFNRALIIEALGISEAARRAWQRYAIADPTSHWSAEAMHHLGNLPVVTTRDEFQNHLTAATRALPDTAPLIALARNYPQEARTWSEGPLLSKWADAIHAGDTKTATQTLNIVRVFGAELAEFNGVHLVGDVVAIIDRASAEPARVGMLADAHAAYRDGRLLYDRRRVADAEEHLRKAAELFARAGSPMAISAEYYLANCLYDGNRLIEASHALDKLLERSDIRGYPATAAEIRWENALCHSALGEWDVAFHMVRQSRKTFSDLGEIQNRADMDLLLASHLNHASQPRAAWKARVAAFPVLSRAGSTDRIRNSLITAIKAETAEGKLESALSLTRIALDELLHAGSRISVCTAESARAETLAKTGDFRAARMAVDRARRSAKAIQDPELKRRTSTYIDIAEAVVERDAHPEVSLRLLTAAISFYTSRQSNAWLPKAYLERGRTFLRAKSDEAARADFEAGIRQLEAQRSAISNTDVRGTFYDTAPELFSETIALLLRKNDVAAAFNVCDAGRARTVREQAGTRADTPAQMMTAEQLRTLLPPDTALIEYALLSDSIVIFYFSSSSSGAVRVTATPHDLGDLVERFTTRLQQRAEIASTERESAALYRFLIAPVAAKLAGAQQLIIIPDRQLHAIPFAALYDAEHRRYVIDDFAISVAPSAASVLQQTPAHTGGPVLVVGDPRNDDAPALPDAAREAEEIAAMYPSSTLLEGSQATPARFIAAARRSSLIHYAGHAQGDPADPFGALYLAGDTVRSGNLDLSAISALHLDKAPLVVLAACGTIRGDSEHVEGMPSIARAFLAAGARNVIGTLWEVDDEPVAPLFRRLHDELRGGADTPTALRRAQLAMAHDADPGRRHPATWAPVELLGYSNEHRHQ